MKILLKARNRGKGQLLKKKRPEKFKNKMSSEILQKAGKNWKIKIPTYFCNDMNHISKNSLRLTRKVVNFFMGRFMGDFYSKKTIY